MSTPLVSGCQRDTRFRQRQVEDALDMAAAYDARVVNLSIGDPSHPYHPPAPAAIAAIVDAFVREHDVVVVISAGNVQGDLIK